MNNISLWKSSACIKYFSQIKCIANASFCHVTLNRRFFIAAKFMTTLTNGECIVCRRFEICPPSIETPPHKQSRFIFFLKSHLWQHFFWQYRPNNIQGHHLGKFMRESYFLIFRGLENNTFICYTARRFYLK